MPWSETGRRPWVLAQLRHRLDLASVRSVVDVGAGAGTWHTFLSPSLPKARWTAIEIWEPYVSRFHLDERYDEVLVADVRVMDPLPAADLYLFGDVMEHMLPIDAMGVWNRARAVSSLLVLCLPVKHYPQGEIDGNPHEAHLADWDIPSVLDCFPRIVAHAGPPPVPPGQAAGAFIAEGSA